MRLQESFRITKRDVLLAGLFPLMSGCILWPNSRVEGYGIRSRVLDAETGEAISGAEVRDVRSPSRMTKTDVEGRFVLKPFVQWHGGIWFGPPGYLPILPSTGDVAPQSREIRISADGYEISRYWIRRVEHEAQRTNPGSIRGETFEIIEAPLEADKREDTLMMPSLSMRRIGATSTRHIEQPRKPDGIK